MNRFKHPLIRCMVSDFCTKESLGYSFPMAYGNFVSGDGGIPRGGSRAMAFRMQKKFESLGGKVYTNADVAKIEIGDNGKAYPVYGMFQAAFAVDSDIDALGGDIMLDCKDIRVADWMSDRMTVKTYAYEPGFAPEGKQIVQVLLGLQEDAYDYWAELYKNKEEYRSKKEEIAYIFISGYP